MIDKEKFELLLKSSLIKIVEFEGNTFYSAADMYAFFNVNIPEEDYIMLPFGADEIIMAFITMPK